MTERMNPVASHAITHPEGGLGMTHPLVAALEETFQQVRDMDLSLADRLRAIADKVRAMSPEFADAVDVFVARLEAAQAGETAPRVGDVMPPFALPDQDGRLVILSDLLAEGPLVIAFYRGHWCPYCRLNMVALAEIEGKVAPARIISITPETQAYTRVLRAEAGAGFPFLSDIGAGYALSINLAILVDEAMASLIESAGWNVPHYQGGTGWILPVPAVFVVDSNGTIIARHVDPDYRRRMEPALILEALGELARRSDS